MAAYWIGHTRVTNEEGYGEYAKLAGPAIDKHGGRFLARGGRCVSMEGEEFPRNVVVEFESVEAAQACYDSPEYQEALAHVAGNAERLVIIVDGL
jgi:uncharacterized protein (DUF1330 family)